MVNLYCITAETCFISWKAKLHCWSLEKNKKSLSQNLGLNFNFCENELISRKHYRRPSFFADFLSATTLFFNRYIKFCQKCGFLVKNGLYISKFGIRYYYFLHPSLTFVMFLVLRLFINVVIKSFTTYPWGYDVIYGIPIWRGSRCRVSRDYLTHPIEVHCCWSLHIYVAA